ncbi:hypothetical protein B0T19DRAFT_435104 [Cercophora scortea]|uniref:Zn(2)-C6 fungal-type domain-containing protein n=1 Tax=Cercophora scortea TaxID=314031 RepID=A0AAE0I344_9PEZI|nr:hypothetical protein B0T19DRAFT_435104 [Cercophora scortea]
MSLPASSNPPFSISKRSACDRCRSQKLRCPPRAHSDEPCSRCSRLGARCNTSYHNPLGRVAKSTPTTAHPLPRLAVKPKNIVDSDVMHHPHSQTPPHLRSQLRSPATKHMPMDVRQQQQQQHQDIMRLLAAHQDQTATPIMSETRASQPPGTVSLFPDDFALHNNPNKYQCDDGNNSNPDVSITTSGNLYTDLDDIDYDFCPLPSPTRTFSISTSEETPHTNVHQQQHNDRRVDHMEPPPSAALEWDNRLSSLCLDLTERLQQCQTLFHTPPGQSDKRCQPPVTIERTASIYDTDIDSSTSVGPMTSADVQQAQNEMPWSSTLFGHCLGDTEEFVTILRSYSSSSLSKDSMTGPDRELGILVVLNLVAAYLQIVTIYDKLLRFICSRLFDQSPIPAGTSSSVSTSSYSSRRPSVASFGNIPGEASQLQILPGLQLAGFFVQQGTLQTKLLIVTMLHQFEAIERLLGLPAEFRVTDRIGPDDEEAGRGLFQRDKRAKNVMTAVMSNIGTVELSSEAVVSAAAQYGDDNSGRSMSILSSLRQTIKKVHTF